MRIPILTLIHNRLGRGSRQKPTSVELRVTYMRKQKFISTGVKINTAQWNDAKKMVVNCREALELNEILDKFKLKALKVINEMVEKGAFDLDAFPALLRNRMEDMTFLEYIASRIDKKQVRNATHKRYVSFLNIFSEWGGIRYFSDINEKNILSMDDWLKGRVLKDGSHMRQSTIFGYHKHLKQFINDAIVDGYIEQNPYNTKRIRISRGEVERIESLTEEQINRIRALDLKEYYLSHTRDLFIFQCYTGMAYADMMAFDINDYKEDEATGKIIGTGVRIKTGSRYYLVLLEPVVEILKKYDWKLPKISNQKYNMYLKAIGAAIGVPGLHSHMGRSSFASLMLNHGVSVEILQRMLGHRNKSQTQRYATMWQETVNNEFIKIGTEIK